MVTAFVRPLMVDAAKVSAIGREDRSAVLRGVLEMFRIGPPPHADVRSPLDIESQ